jgi:hypothetical protein
MNAKRLTRAVAAAILCVVAPLAAAQAWPSKPVRLVAVFPPGGSVDQVARVLAQQLSVQLGQTFLVDNKGGASGSIGTAEVARAAPDGYTFAVVFDTHAVNPSLIPNLSFDTTKDLAPVILIGTSPMAIVTPASQPYKDFRDVIAAAKAKARKRGVRNHRRRVARPPRDGADRQPARRRVHARALPRRRPVDERCDRRAGAARDRHGVPGRAAREKRQGSARSRSRPPRRIRSFPGLSPSLRRACPASRRSPGGGSSRRRQRRRRSSGACTTSWRRRSRFPPWPSD